LIILERLHELEPEDRIIKFELTKLLVKKETTVKRGKKYFEELLKTPNRNYALLELGKLEVSEGNIEKARTYFEELLNTPSRNYALLELLFLSIKQTNYLEAYTWLEIIVEERDVSIVSIKDISFYLKYKMNWLTEKEKKEATSYFQKQLMDYDEEKAIEHIQLHLDENNQKKLHSVFDDSINLQEVFDLAKVKITYINPNRTTFIDKYKLKLDQTIGQYKEKDTDCIEVITFPNEKNILTMYSIHSFVLDEKVVEKGKQKKIR